MTPDPTDHYSKLMTAAPGSRLVRMRIPGFSKFENHVGIGPVRLPAGLELGPWYAEFERRVFDAVGSGRWTPVYRLSDGEFIFMCGRHFGHSSPRARWIARFKHLVNTFRFRSTFYSSGRRGYCECYPLWTLPARRRELAAQLSEISREGMLCFNFSESEISRPYQDRVLRWLRKRGVPLNERSHFHFYHVYGLLRGPRFPELVRGRKVLALTADLNGRGERIVRHLLESGASDAQYHATSTTTPMLDRIDLSKLRFKPDIAFIGAGVGASNIALQLKPTGCVAIDAGFVMDVWGEPELAERRPYLVNDDLWDTLYGKGLPEWALHEVEVNSRMYADAGLPPLEPWQKPVAGPSA